jgi:hypothetical protein
MKRSELNKIIQNAMDFMEEMNFKLPHLPIGGQRNGKERQMNMMKSVIILWAGTSPILGAGISTAKASCFSLSGTET